MYNIRAVQNELTYDLLQLRILDDCVCARGSGRPSQGDQLTPLNLEVRSEIAFIICIGPSPQWRIQGGGWGMHPPPAVRHIGIFCR